MTAIANTPATGHGAAEQRVLDLYRKHLSRGRATLAELFGCHVEAHSDGAWMTTSDGERFLNCGGYGVFILGARHPIVLEEVQRQLAANPMGTRILLEPTAAEAAELLCSVVPKGLERVHFSLSGAEAVETGLKLARANGFKHTVSMVNGYHGKSLGALSATAKDVYQRPFRPLIPDFTHIPFGDSDALEAQLKAHPGETAVILEPVQGEAGVVLPPAGYLRQVEALVREYGGFLILDEVQTGMGRLGEWWGADLEEITPDVLLTGKGIGGGVMPVSAAVATRKAFKPFDKDPFVHTGTFAAMPVLMAAVKGSIRALQEERLVTRAMELGTQLLPRIADIAYRNIGHLVKDVRGQGLLIGVELVEPGLAGELLTELFNNGVVANHSMTGSAVVRFTPPAILTDVEVQTLLTAWDQATRDLITNSATMPDSHQPEGD
ncbi:aspartate aminotransferase family protein [Actinokineospora sp. NPDC004072]